MTQENNHVEEINPAHEAGLDGNHSEIPFFTYAEGTAGRWRWNLRLGEVFLAQGNPHGWETRGSAIEDSIFFLDAVQKMFMHSMIHQIIAENYEPDPVEPPPPEDPDASA